MSKSNRKGLVDYQETRGTFTGIFEKEGWKSGYNGGSPTILLTKIKNSDGKVLADHLWFNYTKGFYSLGQLEQGDVIQFNARCTEYVKGYFGNDPIVAAEHPIEEDYRLSNPTKVKLLNREAVPFPEDEVTEHPMTDYDDVLIISSKELSKLFDCRFVVIDKETRCVVDDCYGYGYKTPMSAEAGYSYKRRNNELPSNNSDTGGLS